MGIGREPFSRFNLRHFLPPFEYMRRHPGQADVVVDEGELLRVAVVQDDGTEDGVRDGRGLGLQEVDGVPSPGAQGVANQRASASSGRKRTPPRAKSVLALE